MTSLPAEGLTFEKVWAMFQETGRRFQETERMVKETSEQQKKTDEQMKRTDEQMKRTDARLDRLAENLGGLGRSMGELIETLIAARLWEKFAAYPYNLKRAYRRIPLYNENSRPIAEIDILLSDTEWVMAVEVKREAVSADVDHHLKRMELIRKYPPAETVGKKLIGAIAAGELAPGTREYAHEAGFFVLELSGESVGLIHPPEGFQPREW